MNTRITTTLASLLLIGVANAQSYYGPDQYGAAQQMQQSPSTMQAYLNQYVNEHGYERLYADYRYWMGQARNMGIGTSTYTFELYVQHRMLTEAGVDVAAMQRNELAARHQWFAGRQRANDDLNSAYDNYNRGWQANQNRQDRMWNDYSSGAIRGEWGYVDPYTGESVVLPTAPNVGETHYDADGNSYFNDGNSWYRNDQGYGIEMEALPHMP